MRAVPVGSGSIRVEACSWKSSASSGASGADSRELGIHWPPPIIGAKKLWVSSWMVEKE